MVPIKRWQDLSRAERQSVLREEALKGILLVIGAMLIWGFLTLSRGH
jgi:hypothetical protein